ncbi:MAG: DUF3800 domain-containing protein [Parvibaculum sp.]|nr:DUF3800 domain-containing protein [Parvibaculum sp.]
MTEPNQIPFVDAYIDESSQTAHRYLVLGAIVLPAQNTAEFSELFIKTRYPELNANSEMKWVKVSKGKISSYLRAVDLFFEKQYSTAPHFHSLVVDTSKINNRRYNQGDREIGFSKEIYHLSMKIGRLYRGPFHIYPDHRLTKQTPDKVRNILNFGAKKRGDKRDWPFRRMQFRHSDQTPMIQLADIFIGAIAYRVNGHHLAKDASPAKIELSRYVLEKAGIPDPTIDTSIRGKFTIWHRKLN